MGRVISTAIKFIDGFTKPSKEVIKSMQKMGNEAIKAGKQIQNAGKTISSVGSTLTTAITLPIAGVATAAVKTAADFEAAMSEVGAISGATSEDMKILTNKAKEMGATTAFSASESAEAMKYMAMAGWKTADMTEGIAGIMNLAAASGEDLAATSDIVTDGLTAFGMAAKESGRFADVMAATSSNANTNVALMGETFKYCASTAGAMGYSIEDISVAIGIMGNAGIKGSMAGTTLKNTIANLAKPTDAQAAMMQKLGISLTDSSGNMKSFAEVMQNLRSSFAGLSETEKAAAATTIAGKESMAGLLTIVNASAEDFDKLTAAINGSSGSAEEMAAKMLDNLKGQLTLLKSALEGIAITIGDKLLPYIKTVVSWVQTAADYINNLSDAQVNNIMKWAGIAAVIPPIIMMFGKVVTAVGTVQRTFGVITKTIANFGGIVGLITSPAGIVIGVLAAIAVAAVLIIKNWDKVKVFLSNVGAWFKNAFEKAGFTVEGFKNKFSSIGNTIGSIAGKIGGFCKSIVGIFKNEFGAGVSEAAGEISGGLEAIVAGAVTAFDGIVTAVDTGLKAFEALLDFFGGAFAGNWNSAAQDFRNSLKNIFPPDIADGLTAAFDKALPVIKAVVEGIKAAFGGLIQDAKTVFSNFKTVFEGVGTLFKGVFTGDAETALSGFKTAAGGAIDAVGNIFKSKINAIKNFVTGALSTFLPQETVNKIAGAFDVVASAWDIAIGAAKGYIDGFVTAIKPVIENIKSIFKGVGQFIKGVFTGDWKGALNGLKTIASGALSGLVNVIKAPFTLIGNTVKGAINTFKSLNIVKTIFTSVGNAIKKVLTKCGVDMNKFSTNINNIKTRVGSIINNLKTIFSTVFGAIGKMVKGAASIVAGIFGKKISSTCSAASAVLTAFKAVVSAVFGFISGAIKKAMNIIVPVVKVAFSAVKGAISAAVQNITAIISGLLTVFDGITTFISGVFTGNWSKAWEGIKSIFKGVFDSLVALCKTPINAVIGIINGAISGINNLGLTIPDWVPVLGGQSFSINIPTIPMLYKGTDNWQGGAAMIHDRGGEIVDLPKGTRVYPHDKSVEMARKEGAAQSGSGSISINIQKLADKIEVRSDEDIDRIAEALALKLKKVAFNTA
jgi:TP901 family phage tail tape measure protein